MGKWRSLLREPAALRGIQSGEFRHALAGTDARHPWPAGFSHPLHAGARHIYRAAAARHREQTIDLSRREPLGIEACEQSHVACDSARLAGCALEELMAPAVRASSLLVRGALVEAIEGVIGATEHQDTVLIEGLLRERKLGRLQLRTQLIPRGGIG